MYQRLGGTGDGGLCLQTGDTVFQDQMSVSTVPWECMHVTCCKSINWRLMENGAGQVSKAKSCWVLKATKSLNFKKMALGS